MQKNVGFFKKNKTGALTGGLVSAGAILALILFRAIDIATLGLSIPVTIALSIGITLISSDLGAAGLCCIAQLSTNLRKAIK